MIHDVVGNHGRKKGSFICWIVYSHLSNYSATQQLAQLQVTLLFKFKSQALDLLNISMILFPIDYLRFYVPLKNFHLYGDVTIAGEGLQNLGLSSALRAFEQGGIFIVPHLL
jgi:hypothetical protein